MFTVPVDVLRHLRIPDRDLYRMLVLSGPKTPTELVESTRLAYHVIRQALQRLERLGVVTGRKTRIGKHHQLTWTAVPYQGSRATVMKCGAVISKDQALALRHGQRLAAEARRAS